MITKTNQEKIKKFFEILSKIQLDSGKNIGLIIVNQETLSDISALTPNSNLVSVYDLTEEANITDLIEELVKNFKQKRTVILRLHNYLDSKLYNQIYLISKSGRIEFFNGKDEIFLEIPKESQLILVSTDKELEKLNYKNLFNIVGPILRLE